MLPQKFVKTLKTRYMTPKWWRKNSSYFFKYALWRGIRNTPRNIRSFLQRGYRGWADEDIWSLDYYLSSWMPEALRRLAETTHGTPMELSEEHSEDAAEKWKGILEKIALGFEAQRILMEEPWLESAPEPVLDDKGIGQEFTDWYDKNRDTILKEEQALVGIREQGLELFVKWFPNLWD